MNTIIRHRITAQDLTGKVFTSTILPRGTDEWPTVQGMFAEHYGCAPDEVSRTLDENGEEERVLVRGEPVGTSGISLTRAEQ
jgi:hypothetical protein